MTKQRQNATLILTALALTLMTAVNSAAADDFYYSGSFCEEEYVTTTHIVEAEGSGGIYNSSTTSFAYIDCPTVRHPTPSSGSVCVQVDVVDNSNDSGSTGIVSCTAVSYTFHFGGFTYTSLSSSGDTFTGNTTLQGTVTSTNYSTSTTIAIDCSLPHWDVSHTDVYGYDIKQGACS